MTALRLSNLSITFHDKVMEVDASAESHDNVREARGEICGPVYAVWGCWENTLHHIEPPVSIGAA